MIWKRVVSTLDGVVDIPCDPSKFRTMGEMVSYINMELNRTIQDRENRGRVSRGVTLHFVGWCNGGVRYMVRVDNRRY